MKGDDSEEPPESDSQWGARIDEQAHQTGLQDDLLQYDNDVVREQVVAATEAFIKDSLLVSEEDERALLEDVLGTKGKFGESCIFAGGRGVCTLVRRWFRIRTTDAPDGEGSIFADFDTRGGRTCVDDDQASVFGRTSGHLRCTWILGWGRPTGGDGCVVSR